MDHQAELQLSSRCPQLQQQPTVGFDLLAEAIRAKPRCRLEGSINSLVLGDGMAIPPLIIGFNRLSAERSVGIRHGSNSLEVY